MSNAKFNSDGEKTDYVNKAVSNNGEPGIKRKVLNKNNSLNCSDENLPINNIGRIMKLSIPENGKISRESKVLMQKLSREFICCVSLHAGKICTYNKRKVVNGEDIINALSYFGYEDYTFVLLDYLDKWKNIKNLKNTRSINNYLQTEYFYSGINKNVILDEKSVIQDYSQVKYGYINNNMIKNDEITYEPINKTPKLDTCNNHFEIQNSGNSVSRNIKLNDSFSNEFIKNEHYKRKNYLTRENESKETQKSDFYNDFENTIHNFNGNHNYNLNLHNSENDTNIILVIIV
ncbi:CCAAT-box DNA binding protein subunit B [Cryptosporidium ryanae]|uniref:CCAAT-box DNA binding protein subunit B n=1 Tax=Cryptosporidium ryanae TaxID=515981 RepID=UPI00351AB129|nr:CCAAT-box DNA binding protein subunit B [Cryptosporidium ryanae]